MVNCCIFLGEGSAALLELPEGIHKKAGFLAGVSYGDEHNSEGLARADKLRLPCDLCGKLGMGQARREKIGSFRPLAALRMARIALINSANYDILLPYKTA